MILDLPKAEDYFKAGCECLLQAYKNIYDVDNGYENMGIAKNELWEYNKIVLNTSLILVHQGVELMIKGIVCHESPLLLIDQKRREWKTLPNQKDVKFSNLYSISGEDLISTLYALENKVQNSVDFISHCRNVRELRNEIIHGPGKVDLTPENIVILVLKSFTFLEAKNAFWEFLLTRITEHPAFFNSDIIWETELVSELKHLDYLENLIGINELNNHFELDLKGRRYYCPYCC